MKNIFVHQKLRFLVKTSFFISLLCIQVSVFGNYSGEDMLGILDSETSSQAFKNFKQYWSLDKDFACPKNGIKVFVNSVSNKVEGLLLTGEGFQLNGKIFNGFSASLPLGILWDDDVSFLKEKLAEGQKLAGRNTLKFYNGGCAVEVSFNNTDLSEISAVKFYLEVKKNRVTEEPVAVQKEPAVKAKLAEKRKQFEEIPFTVTNTKTLSREINGKTTSFKQAVLNVFDAYHESAFSSIKGDARKSKNLWNYKFTYSTKLKIPGEKFNMLYSFPFINSPLDFVSVIKESDEFDGSIESAYRNFEKKLTENFPAEEGWVSSCIYNKESKRLPNLEFRNDKYGAVILDYSRNPNGKHVVYLRFLLFSS